jgi:hypothetical protein
VVGGSQSTEIFTGPVSAAAGVPLLPELLHEAVAASASPAMTRVATLRGLIRGFLLGVRDDTWEPIAHNVQSGTRDSKKSV